MKHTRILLGVLAVMAIVSVRPAFGLSYFGYDEWGGTWSDVNKNGNDDSLLCWAGAASNILEWAGWGTPADSTEQNIFDEFKEHWTNQGGMALYGWKWWLNGGLPPTGTEWAQVNVSGGGNYWSGVNFWDYYYQDTIKTSVMGSLSSYLKSGYGVSLGIQKACSTGLCGHALTVWGYDYESNGTYQGVWVTDSDDRTTTMKRLSVTYNSSLARWDVGDSYSGWHVSDVEALVRNPNGSSCGLANVTLQNVISAGQTVNCYATSTLTLKPGFHAQAGSAFRGYIQAAGAGSSLLAEMQSVSPTTAMDILSGGAGGSDEYWPVAGNAAAETESPNATVPEPTTLMLLGFGLLSLLAFMRRKRR